MDQSDHLFFQNQPITVLVTRPHAFHPIGLFGQTRRHIGFFAATETRLVVESIKSRQNAICKPAQCKNYRTYGRKCEVYDREYRLEVKYSPHVRSVSQFGRLQCILYLLFHLPHSHLFFLSAVAWPMASEEYLSLKPQLQVQLNVFFLVHFITFFGRCCKNRK